MSLQGIKDVAFHHGEKVVLGAVLIFVGLNAYSHFTGGEEGAGGVGPIDIRGADGVSRAIDPAFVQAALPYVEPVEIATPRRTPFWAPMTVLLPPIADLQEKENTKATRKCGSTIVGSPRLVPLTPAEQRAYMPRGATGQPCEVNVGVDPKAKDTLTFEVVRHGHWVAYEALLANENKCRVLVKAARAGIVYGDRIVMPTVDAEPCKEEKLGLVVLRFKQPPKPETPEDDNATTIIRWHLATEYRIYRQSEFDEKRILLARLSAKGRRGTVDPVGRRTPRAPAGYPGGYPGAPPGGRPGVSPERGAEGLVPIRPGAVRPGAAVEERRPAEAEAAKEGEYIYSDRTVESEMLYRYWIEAFTTIAVGDGPSKELKEELEPFRVRTKQKFSFRYVGGTYDKAHIVVYIGQPIPESNSRTFQVPIGARIGDLPLAETPETPAATEPRPGAESIETAKGDPFEFVTRYVLVDIIPDAYRVVPHERAVSRRDEDGKVVFIKETVLREEVARQIIIRDRKNRLLTLWYERPIRTAPAKPKADRRPGYPPTPRPRTPRRPAPGLRPRPDMPEQPRVIR